MSLCASGVALVVRRLRSAWPRHAVWLAVLLMALLPLVLTTWGLAYHIYFDRSDVPDLEPFIRFELSTIGKVYDGRGTVLVEPAREDRHVVSYEEVPPVLRHAILAAEDKNFFTHSGVDYRALPRVLYKAAMSSVGSWWNGDGFRLRLPQGGSTLTQQLVRGYFLRDRRSRENDSTLFRDKLTWRLLSVVVGVPTTNKLFRKLEEVRLALWLEETMSRRFGSRERAKREIFARSASFNYLGNGRYGFAAGSEYYFAKPLSGYTMEDAGKAALLAGVIQALETGLALYETRHPEAKGQIQGSVVVLRNADAAILAEAGGRSFYKNRRARYSDFNRVTGSLRQAGSAWKPMVYLAAFREGLKLDTTVPDEPIAVYMWTDRPAKWIANSDHEFTGPIPLLQTPTAFRNALARS